MIDLKVNEFEFPDAVQVARYTRIVDDQLRDQYDEPTVGTVLCPSRHRPLAGTALSALSTPTFVTTYLLGPAQVPCDSLPHLGVRGTVATTRRRRPRRRPRRLR